jgi:amino acid transporter
MKNMESKYDDGFKEEQETNTEFNLAQGHNQLERGLKSRHIQFLALGMASFSLSTCFSCDRRN